MKILLINHYAGSKELGMEYRPYYLAKEWVKNGHNVTIIASTFSHIRSKQPVTKKSTEEIIIDGITYCWIKTSHYKGNGIGRIFNIFLFVFKLIIQARHFSKKYKPDAVIASSTYPLDIYPASKIAKKTKAKLIYEIHDLWPLSPMELGGYSKHHPFIKIMQIAENYAYKKSDIVISILPKTLEHAVSHGLKPEKWFHIPNGMDIAEWSIQTEVKKEHYNTLNILKSKGYVLVGYIGGHAISNALENIVQAAKLCINEKIHFVLVGDGTEKKSLIKMAKDYNCNNITFLPPIDKTSVPKLLDLFNFLYIGWQNKRLYRFGISPNKLMDYMMAEKPIIHAVNAGNDIVKEASCGISIEPESPQAIIKALDKLLDLSNDEKKMMGRTGKKYINDNHDYKMLAKKFIDVINK